LHELQITDHLDLGGTFYLWRLYVNVSVALFPFNSFATPAWKYIRVQNRFCSHKSRRTPTVSASASTQGIETIDYRATFPRKSPRLQWPGSAKQAVLNAPSIALLSEHLNTVVTYALDDWEQVQDAIDAERIGARARVLFPDRHIQ
jgi:hypothetical protein